MTLPVIRIHSASGSDTQASGAGPDPALFGTSASTDASGLVVTLDPSTDLTAVATDGTHALFLNVTTSGARNFARIVAKDNVLKTVTVGEAYPASLSGLSWAIGGRRELLGSSSSRRLFDNGSTGDAMPGWVVELQSGHSETLTSALAFRRSGDTTQGPITLRGEPSASVRPVLTSNHSGSCLSVNSSGIHIEGIQLRCTSSFRLSGTNGVLVASGSQLVHLRDLVLEGSPNQFYTGIFTQGSTRIMDCQVLGAIENGMDILAVTWVDNCYVTACQRGIRPSVTGTNNNTYINGCLITSNATNGVEVAGAVPFSTAGPRITSCTITGNGTHGIAFTIVGMSYTLTYVKNNVLAANGGFGISFASGFTEQRARALCMLLLNNAFVDNVSGPISIAGVDSGSISPAFLDNPNFASNFTPGPNSNLIGAGYPNPAIYPPAAPQSSRIDPGVVQRQEVRPPRLVMICNRGTH